MDETTPYPLIVKSLIACASRSHRPTLYFISQVTKHGKCEVHEQLPGGECIVWPESYASRGQAEGAIFALEWNYFLTLSTRRYDSGFDSALNDQYAEYARARYTIPHHTNPPVDGLPFCSPPLRAPRIIVTDDHDWIRIILVRVVQLTLPAAEVVETNDGLEAFKAFQSGGCQFLVTNQAMPHLDGPSLIRRVRLTAPDLPVTMVSSTMGARAEAMAAGANWFLGKEQIMEHLPRLLLRYAFEGAKPDLMGES